MFEALGEPETLQLRERPTPTPGPGQVCVEVHAAGCNFADILIGQGKYQVKPALPFAPGSEVAGVISALGPRVDRFELGQRVLCLLTHGGYASHAWADQDQVFPIPEAMPFEDAAGFGVTYQTAYLGLIDRGQLQAGEWLLVHAAAGGVGLSALQIGRGLGAKVIATAGSQDKLDFCLAQGAHAAINYRDADWPQQVKALTSGRGADVIYDPVGGETFERSTKCIAFEGRLVVIGFASGEIPSIRLNRVMLKNIAVTGLHLGGYRELRPERVAEAMAALFALYEDAGVRPAITERYPLEQAPQALRAIAERRTTGKVVLLP